MEGGEERAGAVRCRAMLIILIGYRGSGKSSVGRVLARRLGLAFVDVDDATRARFGGRSIAEIWEREGEAAWREAEARVTRELCAMDDRVIALGGGTPMQPGAREAIQGAGHAVRVYLRCDPDELTRRIAADVRGSSERPALTAGGDAATEVRRVLQERDPVYRAVADEVVDVTRLAVEDERGEGVVDVIVRHHLPHPAA